MVMMKNFVPLERKLAPPANSLIYSNSFLHTQSHFLYMGLVGGLFGGVNTYISENHNDFMKTK